MTQMTSVSTIGYLVEYIDPPRPQFIFHATGALHQPPPAPLFHCLKMNLILVHPSWLHPCERADRSTKFHHFCVTVSCIFHFALQGLAIR